MTTKIIDVQLRGRRYQIILESVPIVVAVQAVDINRRGTGRARGFVGGVRRLRLDGPKAKAVIAASDQIPTTTKEI